MKDPGTDAGQSTGGSGPAADQPEAYIARDLRRALAAGTALPDKVHGCALFADISGFTPLTEALRNELGPQRGAEVLTGHIDRVFREVIEQLDRFGGNVIYFSGDAITCWLDGDDGRRGVASALAMQAAMAGLGALVTPGGTPVKLALKVAVAVGAARRFVVGDPAIQQIDVLAGALLDDLAAAEHQAAQGEVVLDPSALAALGYAVPVSMRRTVDGQTYGVAAGLAVDVGEAREPEPPPLDTALVRPWLLPEVFERITSGRGEFLAELRPAYPLFARFSGIDFDEDERAIDKLDEFVVAAQRILRGYGGNVLQLTLGDKGAYLYGVFGSPIAHENDAARAASAALALSRLDQQTAVRDIRIGIAHGTLRSGTYGHPMRRTFVCLGDAVNLAARLMAAAPAGGVLVAEDVRQAAGDGFAWTAVAPVTAKGRAQPVAAALLDGARSNASSRRQIRYELPLVGRRNELERLSAALDDACASRGRVVALSAEAGVGKSRLIAELLDEVQRRNIDVAIGECQSFGVSTSYFVWREVWQRLLGIDDEAPAADQRRAAEAALARVDPGLIQRSPLLAEVIGVSLADNDLTRAFDAKLRKSSLEDLLATLLRDRAGRGPIVLVLEDCQWIDGLSRDLLEILTRATADRRLLVVLAYRPASQPGGNLGLERLPQFLELTLSELNDAESRALTTAKAAQLFAMAEPPAALVELIVERAEGNPFYAEELLNFVAGQGVDPSDTTAVRRIEMPDSLQSLVLSRIDSLAEDPRRTLKVASVIGRLFHAQTLPGVYPEFGALDDVVRRLDTLQGLDLVTLDQAETLTYLFRHVVTREVSYNSLPFAVRAMLHRRVGEHIEHVEAQDLEPHLDLLAHHFWNADDEARKRLYLRRAEESARRRYANDTAIDYGERLAPLVDGAERIDVLLNLVKVLELTGAWSRAEATAAQAHELAEALGEQRLGARCEAARAELARKQGRYDEAARRLSTAAEAFAALADDEGLGLVHHLSGTVAAQQGDYDAAHAAYEASLEIRGRLEDPAAVAALHSNLAIIAEYRGDYDGARAANEQALTIRTGIGDRWAIAVSRNNLGMIALHEGSFTEARDSFEQSIRASREVGDPWMVAIGHNNLGNAARGLRDYDDARAYFAASLETYRHYEDYWALAFLLEDIAVLAIEVGDGIVACELLGAADSLRDEIGSPRGPSLDSELDTHVAEVSRALGSGPAGAARQRGKALAPAPAIDRALRFARRLESPAQP